MPEIRMIDSAETEAILSALESMKAYRQTAEFAQKYQGSVLQLDQEVVARLARLDFSFSPVRLKPAIRLIQRNQRLLRKKGLQCQMLPLVSDESDQRRIRLYFVSYQQQARQVQFPLIDEVANFLHSIGRIGFDRLEVRLALHNAGGHEGPFATQEARLYRQSAS